MPTLLLDRRTVESLIDMKEVMKAVEEAFAAYGRGEALMPPKVYLDLPQYGGDFRAMPAFVGGAAGLKWVNSHPGNPQRHGLPTVMGIIIYSDPATAYPLAIMDGTVVTRYRTGAAAGLATRYLARPDVRTVGIIGCGVQAHTEILAIANVFTPREALLYDQHPEAVSRVAAAFPRLNPRSTSLEEAAGADVVCTSTPATRFLVRQEWVKPGAHINAMGADGPGKQELDPALLAKARVFVDDLGQASHGGEINVALSQALFRLDQICGTLGQVIDGLAPGRQSADEITIFDSTGLAIQDLATARYLYEKARTQGVGLQVDLV